MNDNKDCTQILKVNSLFAAFLCQEKSTTVCVFCAWKINEKGIQMGCSILSHSSSEKMTGGSSLSCIIQYGHGSSFQCTELFCGNRGSAGVFMSWFGSYLGCRWIFLHSSHIFGLVFFFTFSGINFRTPCQVGTFTAKSYCFDFLTVTWQFKIFFTVTVSTSGIWCPGVMRMYSVYWQTCALWLLQFVSRIVLKCE